MPTDAEHQQTLSSFSLKPQPLPSPESKTEHWRDFFGPVVGKPLLVHPFVLQSQWHHLDPTSHKDGRMTLKTSPFSSPWHTQKIMTLVQPTKFGKLKEIYRL